MKTAMDRILWEYLIAQEQPEHGRYGQKWLNEFGLEGWEVISVVKGVCGLEYTFKRQVLSL